MPDLPPDEPGAAPDRAEASGEGHPVLAGLAALVGVGLVVGLIAGLSALAGTRFLGLGDADAAADSASEQSMYLPRPQKTTAATGPLITLAPAPSDTAEADGSDDPSETESSREPKHQISLSASQTEVAPMQQIDLTGVYPGGEGAVLQVQRFTSGSWRDFPVTVSVSDETFATYVQTSQPGVNRFRVLDTDSDEMSNEVRVRVG